MTDHPGDDRLSPAQRVARARAEADLALPQTKAFLDMVSSTEGTRRHGYNTVFGGGRTNDLSSFPGTGRNTASGRYQITADTFSDARDALGLDDFSPHSQDLAAAWLLHGKAILPYLKIGDFAGALDPASRVWSSLPKGEGSWNAGRYDTARYGFQKAHDFADVQSIYKNALSGMQGDAG